MLHRNLPLKAFSFLLAVFLWVWVLLNEKNPIVENVVKVPIATEGLAAGLALQRQPPDAQIKVRGLRRDMTDVEKQLEAFISCQGLGVGNHRREVRCRAPENLTIVTVRPSDVPVTIEEIVTESRPVELRLLGEPSPGYELISANHSPKVLRVSGPRSRVDRVARVLVSMDLARAVPQVPVSLPMRAVDSSGNTVRGVTLSPSRANVTVSMKSVITSRAVPVVVRTAGTLPAGLRVVSVQVDPPMATILGAADRVQAVAQIETENLSLGSVAGSFTRTLRLIVPADVNLISSPTVKVTMKVETAEDDQPSQGDSEPAQD